MNTSRVEQITKIIQQRQPLGQKIATVEANLTSLAAALHHLENHRNQLLIEVDDSSSLERLKDVDFTTIRLLIYPGLARLNKLKARFSRDTINIGVVGRAN